jgi:hypothetical protein
MIAVENEIIVDKIKHGMTTDMTISYVNIIQLDVINIQLVAT